MTAAFQQILDVVDQYLRTGGFWTLWRPIAGPDADRWRIDDFTEDEFAQYDQLYDLVYMGLPDTATAAESIDGLRGGADLRARVAAWRVGTGPLSAYRSGRAGDIYQRFEAGQRGPGLPFVLGDEVEVIEGVYANRRGTIDLLAYAESPMQYLVNFADGTDEYFVAAALRLIDHAA